MSQLVTKQPDQVKLIVFACEAGMGSSLMGANQLRKLIKKAGLAIDVIHSPVHQIPPAADVVVTHKGLATQARAKAPSAAIIAFQMFMNDPAVFGVVESLKAGRPIVSEV